MTLFSWIVPTSEKRTISVSMIENDFEISLYIGSIQIYEYKIEIIA